MQVGNVSSEVLEVLDVMKESIKLNNPSDEEGLERIDKIKEYIEQKED
jgi:hypothetical protein